MRLLALVAYASLLITQTWSWDEVPEATSYRLYWSATNYIWCTRNAIEIPASVCKNGRCQGDISLPSYSVFIVVTAVNEYGESPTDHGDVIVCP